MTHDDPRERKNYTDSIFHPGNDITSWGKTNNKIPRVPEDTCIKWMKTQGYRLTKKEGNTYSFSRILDHVGTTPVYEYLYTTITDLRRMYKNGTVKKN